MEMSVCCLNWLKKFLGISNAGPSIHPDSFVTGTLRDLNLVHLNEFVIWAHINFFIYLNNHYLDTLLFSIDEKSNKKI